jgi:ribosomal protein S18 acetylase RimI-like enzyme
MSAPAEPSGIEIQLLDGVSASLDELTEAFARLLPQLSSSPPPDAAEVAELLADPDALVFVARDETGRIVGSLTLVLFRIPTGRKARIEDVVVDSSARGRGVGESLSRAALDEAGRRGLSSVDLSSRPSREAANRLYRRLGFVERETNVYRYELT